MEIHGYTRGSIPSRHIDGVIVVLFNEMRSQNIYFVWKDNKMRIVISMIAISLPTRTLFF